MDKDAPNPSPAAVLPYSLRAIYIRDSSTWMDPRFDPLVPGQQLSAVFRTGEGSVDCRETTMQTEDDQISIRSCTFITRFDFAYRRTEEMPTPPTEEDIEKSLVAKISVEIAADYLVNTPDFPDGDALQRWGNSNALLHTWPYWREFCHSTLVRMNLPVTIIPMVQFATESGGPAQDKAPKKTRRAAAK